MHNYVCIRYSRLHISAEENQPLLRDTTSVLADPTELAVEEEEKVVTFLQKGCGCKLAGLGWDCTQQFNQDIVLAIRGQCRKLTHRA